MDDKPIETIVHYIAPDGNYDDILWWIAGVVLFLVSIAFFIIKHFAKGKILEAKPRPCVFVKDDETLLRSVIYPIADLIDINIEVQSQVDKKIEDIRNKYSLQDLDPFKNPYLSLEANYIAAENLNTEIESYIEGMELYYQRVIYDEILSSYIKPIGLVLYAKGRKRCSNLEIDIAIDGDTSHIFEGNSKVKKEGYHDKPPENNELDRSDPFYFLYDNEQIKYTYNEWNFIPVSTHLHFKCASLVSGYPNDAIIPSFLIDTRYQQDLSIKWRINGDEIKEEGKHGVIFVKVCK